jgi:hypothetical protein
MGRSTGPEFNQVIPRFIRLLRRGLRNRPETPPITEVAKAPEAWTIYAGNIHTGDTVISVGPHSDIQADSSLLLAAYQLRNGGRLLIADPQYEMLLGETRDEAVAKAGSNIVGAGSVKDHLEQLASLRNMGVPLAVPAWLGERCTAQHLRNSDGSPIADGSIDAITDNGTSPFIVSSWRGGVISNIGELQSIYDEYARVLKMGGRIILQVDTNQYHTSDDQNVDFRKILEQTGLKVREYQVESVFQIPINDRSYRRIASSQDINKRHLKQTPKGNVLRFPSEGSSIIFIATKSR